jgi:transcriptional regulator with AAA-type ATPase domain
MISIFSRGFKNPERENTIRMLDVSLIKLSLERLLDKVEKLEQENLDLNNRIDKLEKREDSRIPNKAIEESREDTLLDTKDVLGILGVSYNTLRAIINKKLIAPIRINQRRIRYSKKAIYAYIESKSN